MILSFSECERKVLQIITRKFLTHEPVSISDCHWIREHESLVLDTLQSLKLLLFAYPTLKDVFQEDSSPTLLYQKSLTSYMLSLEQTTLQFQCLKDWIQICFESNFDFILLRGQALSLEYYPDPNLRPSWDIDILIRSQDTEQLASVCQTQGLIQRQNIGELNYFRSGPLSMHLDVHTDLWYDPRIEDLWMRSPVIFRENISFRTLCPEDLWVHLIAHSMMHHARFLPADLIDLMLLVEQRNLDWTQIEARVRGSWIKNATHLALQSLKNAFQITIPKAALELFKPTGAQAISCFILAHCLQPYERTVVGHLLRPFAIQGWRRRWQFIWNQILPSDDFLKMRYQIKSRGQLFQWRLFRPFVLIMKMITNVLRLAIQACFRCGTKATS